MKGIVLEAKYVENVSMASSECMVKSKNRGSLLQFFIPKEFTRTQGPS